MSPDVLASSLLAHYYAAEPSQRRRGRAWYPTAYGLMADLAAETGHTVEQAVAVLAITSPGVYLKTNIRWTEEILRGEIATAGRFPNVNRPKIERVLADAEYAAEYVRGPKVGPFFRAILGDRDALVLDRWAIHAATGWADREDAHRKLTVKTREAIEDAYRAAAKSVRMSVRDFQATVWIRVRETTPVTRRGKTLVPKLADITA